MGVAAMAVLGMGLALLTLTISMVGAWDVDAMCPGSDAFCDGIYWQTVVDYLPGWLFIGHLVVILALASPYAVVRVGR